MTVAGETGERIEILNDLALTPKADGGQGQTPKVLFCLFLPMNRRASRQATMSNSDPRKAASKS